mmetsp:Transcript_29806/g.63425  ORF Transcript_29806/g.63425 Transcript_29806/m.63425 type:complete len:220 (-) Transcript_29806:1344-2003(-)
MLKTSSTPLALLLLASVAGMAGMAGAQPVTLSSSTADGQASSFTTGEQDTLTRTMGNAITFANGVPRSENDAFAQVLSMATADAYGGFSESATYNEAASRAEPELALTFAFSDQVALAEQDGQGGTSDATAMGTSNAYAYDTRGPNLSAFDPNVVSQSYVTGSGRGFAAGQGSSGTTRSEASETVRPSTMSPTGEGIAEAIAGGQVIGFGVYLGRKLMK